MTVLEKIHLRSAADTLHGEADKVFHSLVGTSLPPEKIEARVKKMTMLRSQAIVTGAIAAVAPGFEVPRG